MPVSKGFFLADAVGDFFVKKVPTNEAPSDAEGATGLRREPVVF